MTTAARLPSRALSSCRRLVARVVVVEDQEGPGAAPERRRNLVHTLRPQRGHCGIAPGRQGEVVEDPFGDNLPKGRRRYRGLAKPSTGLGPGKAWKRGLASGCTALPVSHRALP